MTYNPRMRIEVLDSPERFLSDAAGFLALREAENNLLYGIAGRVREHPDLYGDDPAWFAIVREGSAVVGAALRTPPWPIIVSHLPEAAVGPLLAAIRTRGPLSGVTGPSETADAVAAASGAAIAATMDQLLYEVTDLLMPTGVPGAARPGAPADGPLLARWFDECSREVGEPQLGRTSSRRARLAIEDGQVWIWDDPGPVSMALWSGPTPRGVRIGLVYTPPERRRRGYAGAVTAAVTADRLRSGRTFCFLFTDAANPTSNSVYRRLGYRQIGTFRRHLFPVMP